VRKIEESSWCLVVKQIRKVATTSMTALEPGGVTVSFYSRDIHRGLELANNVAGLQGGKESEGFHLSNKFVGHT
jgi:hypothetical protein